MIPAYHLNYTSRHSFCGRILLLIVKLQGDSQISGSVHLGGAVVAAVAWAGVRKGRF